MPLLFLCASTAWGDTFSYEWKASDSYSSKQNKISTTSWTDEQGVTFTITPGDMGYDTDDDGRFWIKKDTQCAISFAAPTGISVTITGITIHGKSEGAGSEIWSDVESSRTECLKSSNYSNYSVDSKYLGSSFTTLYFRSKSRSVLSNYTRFTSITFSYTASYPVFSFSAVAVNPTETSTWGSVSTSVNNTSIVGSTLSQTSASTTATFTATANSNYIFEGWYRSADFSGTKISENTTYQETIYNNTINSTAALTLYAHFAQSYTPIFNVANQELKVGQEYSGFSFEHTSYEHPTASSDDKFYYIISENQVPTNANTPVNPNSTEIISFDGTTVTALNEGTAKIKFYQQADDVNHILAGESDEITITVSKNANTISIDGTTDAYAPSLTFADNKALTITSSNSSGPAYVVTYTSGDGVTSYANGTISSTFNAGTDVWTVTQAEDYMYEAGEATITATVVPLSETCYLVNDGNEYNLNDNAKSYTWTDILDVAGLVTFVARKDENTSNGFIDIAEYNAGSWTEQLNSWCAGVGSGDPIKKAENSFEQTISTSSKGIKFSTHGTTGNPDWGYKYVKNVKVVRIQFLTPSVSSLDLGTTLANVPATKSFTLDWSSSQNAGNIIISSNNSHFTVSTDNVSFGVTAQIANAYSATGRSGRNTIYVKYVSDEADSHEGTITIYDKGRTRTVSVEGTTQGKYNLVISGSNITSGLYVGDEGFASGFTFSYEGSEVEVEAPVNGDAENFDPSKEGNHFYYTITDNTADEDATWPDNYSNQVVSYNPATGELHAYNAGTATITFHEYGTDEVNAIEEEDEVSFTITVSKHTPSFATSFTNAVANKSYNIGEFYPSPENPSTPSFSIKSGNAQAQIINNVLYAYSEGTATFTVTQATTYYYEAVNSEFTVNVAASIWEWIGEPVSAANFHILNVGNKSFLMNNNTLSMSSPTTWSFTGNENNWNIGYDNKYVRVYYEGSLSKTYYAVTNYPNAVPTNLKESTTANYEGKCYQFNSVQASDYYFYCTDESNFKATKNNTEKGSDNAKFLLINDAQYQAYVAYQNAATWAANTSNHLSNSLRAELNTVMTNNNDASTNYKTKDFSTCKTNLDNIVAKCSTYVAHLEEAESFHRDISGNGYYMFYNASEDARLGDDVQAYTASWSGDNLVLTAVPNQVIPAATVALVYSNSKSVFYYALEEATASSISGNAFVHHDESYNSIGQHTDYILSAIRNPDNESDIDYYAFRKYTGSSHDTLLKDKNVLVWTSSPLYAPSMFNIFTEENIATALVPVYEDNSTVTDSQRCTKLLIDGKLYIKQDNTLYDVLGRKVQ